MFSNVFAARDGQRSNASASPELPRVTSDIQEPLAQEAFTSGIPHPRSSQSPKYMGDEARRALQTPAQQAINPAQPHSDSQAQLQFPGSAPSPGRARIEVVLNVSPFKTAPGKARFYDADDLEDAPVTSKVAPKKKRGPKPKAHSALKNSTSANPSATVAPAGPSTTGKRPRGRPKGWRPGMPSTKTGLLTASAYKYIDEDGKVRVPAPPVPKTTGVKRRGRPPREPSPTPRGVWEKLVEPPKYVRFLCEWTSCKAELQNIETLRKHIRVVHGRADPLVCKWAGCDSRSPEFTQDYEFQDHVDEEHLVPFVWHVGDGQRNEKPVATSEMASFEVPAYLFSTDGEQVTPSVENQEIEDFLTWRENRRRLRNIIMQRDANAPLEEVDDANEDDNEDEDEDGNEDLPA
ncbi:hypothetical protein VMCG_07398 [Cytospora schulzeri]|uniref:C2H2-type domain-containing protein n=1 Tax=Cytospora schulzeri TaxID=448051 RepID=A0A423W339_9PEZI|nr:hypothetical protein VMCG_07398 [Valsa malicola]